MDDSAAYLTTQNVIFAVLKGDFSIKPTNTGMDAIDNMMKYYNELLALYQQPQILNADAYVDIYA